LIGIAGEAACGHALDIHGDVASDLCGRDSALDVLCAIAPMLRFDALGAGAVLEFAYPSMTSSRLSWSEPAERW
jgi:hypothetical protein